MATKTYSIFGAGAAGLYTAWRLLNGKPRSPAGDGKQLRAGDTLEMFDWGTYDFSSTTPGTRAPGARVCTWHYQNDKRNSYLEVGGMRYSRWDRAAPNANDGTAAGHRVVTTVIAQLGLDRYEVPFNESTNPLFYLRSKNMYLDQFSSQSPAPYNAARFAAATSPDTGFAVVENLAVTATTGPQTRAQWDDFYQHGRITAELPKTSVFQTGDSLRGIGYWNLMYDQLGGEGYNYAADGNGYSSNVINWNSAVAFEANNEFTPGTTYSTITCGYSGMFTALYAAIVKLAQERGVVFTYTPATRLQSIVVRDQVIRYTLATRAHPWEPSDERTTTAAWLAMPRHAVELVARGSRFGKQAGVVDVLNGRQVKLYLEAAVMQPSYKVGMFFDSAWWLTATYPAQLTGYVVTHRVLAALSEQSFPAKYLPGLGDRAILGVAFSSSASFLAAVEQQLQTRLTIPEEQQLLAAATRQTIGPSVTDMPIRQAVYFGNNASGPAADAPPVYGLLAAYDDEQFASFWRELELEPDQLRQVPSAEDFQTLDGPRTVPPRMVKMLRKQLAELHYGPNADYAAVPEPLEARYMDWSLPPFNAGYHAWAAHYDIADVQQKIRKPSQLVEGGADADIFIVGEAYSNDQAWVEGAYCTAESVLNDFFDLAPIIDDTNYPFICRTQK